MTLPLRALAFLLFAASSLTIGSPATPALAEEPTVHNHGGLEHHAIRIRERRVSPEKASVASNNAITWVNYTANVLVVSFDESVADKLICTGPSNFTWSGGRLVSKPLRANEFASVCMFKPGTYAYEIKMLTIAHSGGPDLGKNLTGSLVVN